MYQTSYPDKIKDRIFRKPEKKEEKKKDKSASTSGKKSDKKDKGKAPTSKDKKKEVTCNYCKQPEHYADKCPKLAADKAAGTFILSKERLAQRSGAKGNTNALASGSGKGQSSGKKMYLAPPADGKTYQARTIWEEVTLTDSPSAASAPAPVTVGTIQVPLAPTTRLKNIL
ncbi:hypothetical protein WOLCODRAFT_158636 [Wolfiporia cocos MD-104 SS10]|uniref:CCHC-type domain-containing protein n=1 Tax=Wolfiporia cocos (strain MD-104) TaxID=742152 RepID=A0A2H3JBZ5_WOLCO|nr:hypothetical protein WOLCODRAFT_158636 [Wolfiporia cocos MD-104 SS10]